MKVQEVNLTPVDQDFSLGLSDEVICTCSFCGKTSSYPSVSREMCEKMSKPGQFFCQFCLRHGHYTKNSKDILIMSFRGVIAHYYVMGYKKSNNYKKPLYLSQIKELIAEHVVAGMMHPAFNYDDESLLWFVDFQKIGKGQRELPIESVHRTVINILASFNLWDYFPQVRPSKLYGKYEEAINLFYSNRIRPADKKILTPTFTGCGITEPKECPFEWTRGFTPDYLCF